MTHRACYCTDPVREDNDVSVKPSLPFPAFFCMAT